MQTAQKQPPSRNEQLLQGKLNILSAIMKLGHDSFSCQTFKEWLSFVVNNSVLAFKYNRSAIIDVRTKKCPCIAISGQSKINQNSELALQLTSVCKKLPEISTMTVLDENFFTQYDFSPSFYDDIADITDNSRALVVAPLKQNGKEQTELLWIIEFNDLNNAKAIANLVALLVQHYNESLHYILNKNNFKIFNNLAKPKALFSPMKIAFLMIILFLISLVIVRLPLMSKAEFELIPALENVQYAPLDGIISKTYFKNGDKINKNDKVLDYETKDILFALTKANASLKEANSRFDTTYRESFVDPKKLAQLEMLKLEKEQAKIAIEKNQYYLKRSIVNSKSNGVIAIDATEKLEGKFVRKGQKLFEILTSGDIVAEIFLDQKNASVLNDLSSDKIELTLETMPEKVFKGELISLSPKPILTEKNLHCYVIKVKLKNLPKDVIYGMRGNASLYGDKVSLGYFLFKNVVLWWRKSI
ncbi:efflux RND transporter periplasmic adaptor subunit [Lentisphaerota bacterium WC36G]|nr:HlyD family efflux transporter periplasmic adaptor subunit [Lentisphaerae bacterium WC36]